MNTMTEATTQTSLLDFAVIGAGIAGLTAAKDLKGLGYSVAVFEKARGTGGRLSSKCVAYDNGAAMAFDLGCVSMSAKSAGFIQQLEDWHEKGIIEPWWTDNNQQTHYVAVSRNSALTRHLSQGIELHFATRILSLKRIDHVWHLFGSDTGAHESVAHSERLLARAKNIIIATPPAQADDLLPADSPFKTELAKVDVSAQWVMALEVENDLSDAAPIAYPASDIVFSISQESRKPGRESTSTILQVQASASWTSKHLDASHEDVSATLITALEAQLGQSLNIINAYVHRWLYSRTVKGIEAPVGYLWDENGLGIIGDYFNTDYAGVESSWLSGKQMVEKITRLSITKKEMKA